MTRICAKYPLALREVQRDMKGHDERSHKRVHECQAHDEYVLHTLQGFVREHGQNDQNVAEYAREAYDYVNKTFEQIHMK